MNALRVCLMALGMFCATCWDASAGPLTHVLVIGYSTAAAIDIAQTSHAVGQGVAHEANPVLAPFAKASPVPAMALKGAMHAGIADLLLHKRGKGWTALGVSLLAAQVAVDVLNAHTLRTVPGR